MQTMPFYWLRGSVGLKQKWLYLGFLFVSGGNETAGAHYRYGGCVISRIYKHTIYPVFINCLHLFQLPILPGGCHSEF